MGSKKLVYCCIAGILLGFLIPLIFHTEVYSTLMIGMVAGLGVGYLLDKRDEELGKSTDRQIANQKAAEANKLMERARRGLENEYLRMDYDDEEEDPAVDEELPAAEEDADFSADQPEQTDVSDPETEEQVRKLNDAEELLRAARERMEQDK